MNKKVGPVEVNGQQCQNGVGPQCGEFINSRGTKLHSYYWKPKGNIRALVFLCHGFAEHLLWYDELALRFTSIGVMAFGHDHLGHGRSGGVKGHISHIREYVTDVINHCEKVSNEYNKKLFLVGHSMGGMISISAMNTKKSLFSGAVLMSPLIDPNPSEATPLKMTIAKIISNIIPLFPVSNLSTNLVTRDPESKKKMNRDTLRYHGGIRARWAMACNEQMSLNKLSSEDVTWPFLIIHSEKDGICSPEGSKFFYKNARSSDKKLKMFEDAYHHLYIEIPEVRREALHDTVQWIEERIGKDT